MAAQIRQASSADVEAVVRVIKAVFDEYSFTWDPADYHADLYDLDAHYGAKGNHFFVAEVGGRIEGTVALELFPQLPGALGELALVEGARRVAGADCSLERLYVHPAARNQGLGRALVQHVVDEARARGRNALELWSDKRFGDAHRLYQRFGAKVIGDRVCHDPDQSPEWGLLINIEELASREKRALTQD